MSATVLFVVIAAAGVAFALSHRKSGGSAQAAPAAKAGGWYIGPIANGKNYSENMPATPTLQGNGWYIDLPSSGGVDAVVNTTPPSLVGAKSLAVNYAVTGSGFLAAGENNVPGRVGICIQRRGDNWSGSGKYQQYRLYGQDRPLLVAGDGTFTASVWTDVQGQVVDQAIVDGVLADLDNYMIVFGGSFASHGVYATEASRFYLLGVERGG